MNNKEALERMRDLEKLYNYHMDSGAEGLGWEAEKEAKEIYDKFKDGCYKFHKKPIKDGVEYYWCGKDGVMKKCPTCQEIKEIAIRFDTDIVQSTHSEEGE